MVVSVALGEQTPPGGWQWVADDLPAPVTSPSTSRSPTRSSSKTAGPVVPGLDGTDADLREFIDLKVGTVLQRLEGQEKILEWISHRLEKGPETWKAQPLAGRWSGSRRPSASMAAGLMPISSSGASSYALDLVPISPRNSNPSSSQGGAMHFATRMRQSNHDLHRKGSVMAEEFASYSRTDAQMLDVAKDQGVRHMVAAVERMKGKEVGRSFECEMHVCGCLCFLNIFVPNNTSSNYTGKRPQPAWGVGSQCTRYKKQ